MIGIMGGTFDPIHYGHLRIAEETAELFGLDEVHFIPAKQPALKLSPRASSEQRADWVQLAIKDNPHFHFNHCEMLRDGKSYTIDTLRALRQEKVDQSIVFIMGVDAFNQFEYWKNWQEILTLCHIVVCDRPHSLLKKPNWSQPLWQKTPQDVFAKESGYLYLLAATPIPISSTLIRKKVANQQSIRYLVPDSVAEEISQQQIYLPRKRS